MANLNLDTNSWYEIIQGSSTVQSLDGTMLYNQGNRGAVFFQNTNLTEHEQQWQLFPFNSTYYVLRTRRSGPFGYMIVRVSNSSETLGNTVAEMANATLSDASMFWTIGPWQDGTFYLTNAANGTSWHLNVEANSLMAMSSNITGPQKGQRFSFVPLDKINDVRFSSVVTPSASATSAAASTSTGTLSTGTLSTGTPTTGIPTTGTPTNSAPSTTTSASSTSAVSKSGGLSTGAKAGIGASIGGVALILLILLGLFFFRQRKRRPTPADLGYSTSAKSNYDQNQQMLSVQELHPTDIRHEMDVPPTELQSEGEPSELPGESRSRAREL